MILVYKTLTKAELLESISETIEQLKNWFSSNPNRQDCVVELWYGKIHTLTRENWLNELKLISESVECSNEFSLIDEKKIINLIKDPLINAFWEVIKKEFKLSKE